MKDAGSAQSVGESELGVDGLEIRDGRKQEVAGDAFHVIPHHKRLKANIHSCKSSFRKPS